MRSVGLALSTRSDHLLDLPAWLYTLSHVLLDGRAHAGGSAYHPPTIAESSQLFPRAPSALVACHLTPMSLTPSDPRSFVTHPYASACPDLPSDRRATTACSPCRPPALGPSGPAPPHLAPHHRLASQPTSPSLAIVSSPSNSTSEDRTGSSRRPSQSVRRPLAVSTLARSSALDLTASSRVFQASLQQWYTECRPCSG